MTQTLMISPVVAYHHVVGSQVESNDNAGSSKFFTLRATLVMRFKFTKDGYMNKWLITPLIASR